MIVDVNDRWKFPCEIFCMVLCYIFYDVRIHLSIPAPALLIVYLVSKQKIVNRFAYLWCWGRSPIFPLMKVTSRLPKRKRIFRFFCFFIWFVARKCNLAITTTSTYQFLLRSFEKGKIHAKSSKRILFIILFKNNSLKLNINSQSVIMLYKFTAYYISTQKNGFK